MAEIPVSGEIQEVTRAKELLSNPDIIWHSVNGFDLGAILGITTNGIVPSKQFGGKKAVSLVASPVDHRVANHRLFDFYTSRSVSFPVARLRLTGGLEFVTDSDEVQYGSPIKKDYLLGIMIPQSFADSKLTDLPIIKPPTLSGITPYITRQIDAFRMLDPASTSSQEMEDLSKILDSYKESYDDYRNRKHLAGEINKLFLGKYQTIFERRLGISQPSLQDIIRYISDTSHLDLLFLPEELSLVSGENQ